METITVIIKNQFGKVLDNTSGEVIRNEETYLDVKVNNEIYI